MWVENKGKESMGEMEMLKLEEKHRGWSMQKFAKGQILSIWKCFSRCVIMS